MPTWLLNIPLEARCLAVFVIGLGIGSFINWGIYALAWNARPISPWSRKHKDAPPRRWHDRLPVVGWFGLRREAPLWKAGFWVRPVLLELVTAGGLALLYYWEVTRELLPPQPWGVPAVAPAVTDIVHFRFISHALLIVLMIVATFIDFDEKTIPDTITVPGTLLGLALAYAWPWSTLHDLVPPLIFGGVPTLEPLLLTSPNGWSPRLNGVEGLAFGLFCYLGWCFGILEKLWTLRRGWKKAFQYFFVSIGRAASWPIVLALAAIGTPLIMLAWSYGGLPWQALLSALAGVAFGGGLVWAIRIIGTHSLGQEAMGFGDVTLMAMIGAFVGWQGALIAFFIAPFTALFIALAQWLATRRHELAFGPYLCAGALIVLLRWSEIWAGPGGARPTFSMGWFIPGIVVVCLGLMWVMLAAMRWFRLRFFGGEEA